MKKSGQVIKATPLKTVTSTFSKCCRRSSSGFLVRLRPHPEKNFNNKSAEMHIAKKGLKLYYCEYEDFIQLEELMKKILLLVFVCALFVSCGKKEVKPLSQESKTSQEAFILAETIKNAFVANDSNTLQKNSTEKGYRDIAANAKGYDSVEFTFTPRWVDIENNQILLNIAWRSTWVVAGRSIDDRGMAVFAMEGTPLKVSQILRGNPFILPGQ